MTFNAMAILAASAMELTMPTDAIEAVESVDIEGVAPKHAHAEGVGGDLGA